MQVFLPASPLFASLAKKERSILEIPALVVVRSVFQVRFGADFPGCGDQALELTKTPNFPFIFLFSSNFYLPFARSDMIKIRLQRHGAKHAPFYRMVVAPSTSPRDGKFIEVLGTYDPQAHARTEELKLKMDRIDHWLGVGAQPTDTAKSLIRQGRLSPEEWLERAEKNSEAKKARAKKKAKAAPVAEEVSSEEPTAEEESAEEPAAEEPAAEEESAEEESAEEPAAEEESAEDEPVADEAESDEGGEKKEDESK